MGKYIDLDWLDQKIKQSGKGEGWLRLNCPVCLSRTNKQDTKASFGVNVISGIGHCFRCNYACHVPGYAAIDDDLRADDGPVEVELPSNFLDLWKKDVWTSVTYTKARKYLTDRGLGRAQIKAARIGACLSGWHLKMKVARRIVIPMYAGEILVGWTARDYTGAAVRKYLFPEGMRKSKVLYNHDSLYSETDEPIIVVEGVFDALAVGPNAVAVLGKPSEFQIEALRTANRPIIVALDGDAWKEAMALCMKLRLDGVHAGWLKLPARTDPAELGKEYFDAAKLSRCLNLAL